MIAVRSASSDHSSNTAHFLRPPTPTSASTTTTTMGLFNRKNKGKSEDGTSEKKAGWKRPASASRTPTSQSHNSCSIVMRNRYRLQTTTTQSLAAHPHTQDRPPHSLRYIYRLRPHRCAPHLGQRPRLRDDHRLHQLRTTNLLLPRLTHLHPCPQLLLQPPRL